MNNPSSPLVTIVTITFNASSNIVPTLESVQEQTQTFDDFEHIIVDGASSDDTLLIARRLGVPSLRILSEPDDGLYFAMNKALDMARGKYILFLNAGDAFHASDTLRSYADAIYRCDPDIIYSDTVIVDKVRRVIGPRHLSVPDILTPRQFEKGMLICHQAFMVRRSLAPHYDTSYRFSADYDWTIRCIKRTTPQKCVNLAMVGIEYLKDGLTDRNHLKSLRERFDIMSYHFGFLRAVARHLSFIPRLLKH